MWAGSWRIGKSSEREGEGVSSPAVGRQGGKMCSLLLGRKTELRSGDWVKEWQVKCLYM